MKINFLLTDFPENPIGGFKVVYQYSNYLVSKGNEVNIIHTNTWSLETRYKGLFGMIKLMIRRIYNLFYVFFKKPKVLWFRLNKKITLKYIAYPRKKSIPNADVTIATGWQTAQFVNSLPQRCGNEFYFIQDYEIWATTKKNIINTWKLPLTKIVISKSLKEIGDKIGVKTVLIPNFVDNKEFYLTNSIVNRAPQISMLFSEQPRKRSYDGLNAISIIKKKYPHIKVVLFGVGNKPVDISFDFEYYRQPSKQVLREKIYNKTTIFVCSSLIEGWGLTSTEAMLCGAALVSTANGGVDNFGKNMKTALITPPGQIRDLSNSILKLVVDEELRIELANNGYNFVKHLTLNNSGKQFFETINI